MKEDIYNPATDGELVTVSERTLNWLCKFCGRLLAAVVGLTVIVVILICAYFL